jgi:multiple sugar transport system permease protein
MNWDLLSPPTFAGITNYKKVLTSPMTWKVLGNTLYFITGYMAFTIMISLLLALALSNKLKGHILYRTIFFLPNITSAVAISLVWLWLFNPEMGLVNAALSFFGVAPLGWYASLQWAMPTVILMAVWQSIGYYMIIFLAGLNGISNTYYEAANIDGAGKIHCFFRITLPLLTPTLFFIVTMMLIGGFQVFSEMFMITGGGPSDSTKSIVMQIYNEAFRYFRMGDAAVLSWILFIIILTVTLIQFKFQNRWVNYDA